MNWNDGSENYNRLYRLECEDERLRQQLSAHEAEIARLRNANTVAIDELQRTYALAKAAEQQVISLQQQLEAPQSGDRLLLNDYGRRCYDAGRASLTQQVDQLKGALEQLDADADYSLTQSGQRTRPARFVPSVAKYVKDITSKALSPVAREAQSVAVESPSQAWKTRTDSMKQPPDDSEKTE
jgi:hypothetical protein